jgi:hypothetical protein
MSSDESPSFTRFGFLTNLPLKIEASRDVMLYQIAKNYRHFQLFYRLRTAYTEEDITNQSIRRDIPAVLENFLRIRLSNYLYYFK